MTMESLGSKAKGASLSSKYDNEEAFPENRCFVVLREGHGSAVSCPLQLFQKQIMEELWYRPQDMVLIYLMGAQPQIPDGKQLAKMEKFPIVVEDAFPWSTSALLLCLNLSRAFTIEHDVMVRNIGRIDRTYLKNLRGAFLKVMGGNTSNVQQGESSGDDPTEDVNAPTSNPLSSFAEYAPSKIASSVDSWGGYMAGSEEETMRITAPKKESNLDPSMTNLFIIQAHTNV